jgi:hypothetical protein
VLLFGGRAASDLCSGQRRARRVDVVDESQIPDQTARRRRRDTTSNSVVPPTRRIAPPHSGAWPGPPVFGRLEGMLCLIGVEVALRLLTTSSEVTVVLPSRVSALAVAVLR